MFYFAFHSLIRTFAAANDVLDNYLINKDNMEVIKTDIKGVLIIEPKVFGDKRGYFFESFSQREFDEKVVPILDHKVNFVQDNESMSSYGVMRGLHFQNPPYTQSKLVRCVKGAVLDVAVDVRMSSPTFGKYVAVELNEDNKRQFFIPRGFAHGFLVLSDEAEFCYKCDDFYHPDDEGGLAWNDPKIGIVWPGVEGKYPGSSSAEGYTLEGVPLKLAARDQKWPGYRDLFPY